LSNPSDVGKQLLFMSISLTPYLNARHLPARKCSDKEVVSPTWIFVAGIKKQAARRDGRHTIMYRLLHAKLSCFIGNDCAIVVNSVCDRGPPVISTFLYDIQFITATGAVLYCINKTVCAIVSHTLDVVVTIRPNTMPGMGIINKRVIHWYTSVVMKPVYFAYVV